jgi:heme/copper-type cytochrome/quinol oxidase subunit 2
MPAPDLLHLSRTVVFIVAASALLITQVLIIGRTVGARRPPSVSVAGPPPVELVWTVLPGILLVCLLAYSALTGLPR